MKLYNTLTRTLEEIKPLNPPAIGMYSCGPTVYDHIHIGNLSAFIFADTLRRTLTASGESVHHVMNFTDVDDKTIRRSRERYPELDALAALQELTSHYGDIFLEDMAKVGNDISAYDFVKATDPKVIEGMQNLIRELVSGGFAYIADDGVYFSISAYVSSGKKYGQLSEISTANTGESRIQNDEYDKESAHDFALWKKQKDGEPAWQFELDGHDLTGRPGWHIECSVMSSQNLGQPFDIHTGGIDLIFPHHENEIAQSTAGKSDPVYARHFAHNEHILVDGKKMSKSLGNFYTLEDIIKKGYDPLAFRVLVLQSHYRSQSHFSWENLEAAQNRLKGYQEAADLRFQAVDKPSQGTESFEAAAKEILACLQEDLNSPQALTVLSAFVDVLKGNLLSKSDVSAYISFLRSIDSLLGTRLSGSNDVTSEQKQLIADRQTAREAKDWSTSDDLRDKLTTQGIGVRDTQYGPIWYRI